MAIKPLATGLPDAVGDQVTGTTTNDYANALDWASEGFASKTIVLKNTHATNALLYKVLTYAYSGGVELTEVSEATLAVGTSRVIRINQAYAVVKVQVKSSVADTHATYMLEYIGDRAGGGAGSGTGGAVQNMSSFIVSDMDVTAASTAEQLPSVSIPDGFALLIKAKPGNTGNIYHGESKLKAEAHKATMQSNESYEYKVTNANLIWIDAATSGEGIEYAVEQG